MQQVTDKLYHTKLYRVIVINAMCSVLKKSIHNHDDILSTCTEEQTRSHIQLQYEQDISF
jgi:hypothetical protein